MIKSMTGYGRSKQQINGRDITFEIRSVNNRFIDLNIRLHRAYAPLEDRIKQLVSETISRGKIDISVTVDLLEGETVELSLNREYLESYLALMENIKEEYDIKGDVTLAMLSSKQEIFNARRPDADMDEMWSCILPVAKSAIEQFMKMRETEGEKLKADILSHLDVLREIAGKIKERAPEVVKEYNEKMRLRIQELLGDVKADESRLLTECAVFADKADINEELVRLYSHFDQFAQTLEQKAPVGRKLDFMLQELNREINTTGSKSNDLTITQLVIEGKSELEKIREQIQNIE